MSTDLSRISEEETSGSIADTLKDLTSGMNGDDFRITEGGVTDEEPEGRARDEHGRFAPKTKDDAPTEAAPVAENPDQQQGVQPPASWSKEHRETFAKLPPDVQRYITERERERDADYTRKTQEIADIRRFSDEIRPIIDKHQQLIAHTGAAPAQVMDQLFGMYAFSQRDPAGYLKWAAQSLGVDLSTMNQAPDEYVDPAFNELRQTIDPLRQQVQGVTSWIQQQEELRVQNEIASFANAADANGPLHPHFEKVKVEMGRLMGAGIATSLQDAYDRAVWADPSIREELTKPKTPDPVVENAKRVAALNHKPKGVSQGSEEPTGSMRDTLRDEMRRKLG